MSDKNNFIDVQEIMSKKEINVEETSVKDVLRTNSAEEEKANTESEEVEVVESEVKEESVKTLETTKAEEVQNNKSDINVVGTKKKVKKDKKEKPGDKTSKKKKITIIVVASVLVLAALVFIGSLAVKDSGVAVGSGTGDTPDVQFQEQFLPVDDDNKEYKYIIMAKNNTNGKYYLRVKVNSSMSDEVEAKWLEDNVNSKHWEYKDGYFYYKGVLEGKAESESVLSKVVVDNAFLINGGETVYLESGEFVEKGRFDSAEKAFESNK